MGLNGLRVLGLGLVWGATACGGASLHPVETVITLTAGEVASKVARHYEFDDELWCSGLNSGGLAPLIQPNPNDIHVKAVIGWEFRADYGSQPLPCGYALHQDYMAALYFDLTSVLEEGGAVAHAELRFRRTDTVYPIDVPGWGPDACTLYALDPWSDWIGGYYSGDESESDANPPASLLHGGVPRGPIQFMNSADPRYAVQIIDVTNLISTAVLSRGSRYHGILLSPRPDPSSRANYLASRYILGGLPTHGSCTGLFQDFELQVTLVHVE